jgi:hypothetical protein
MSFRRFSLLFITIMMAFSVSGCKQTNTISLNQQINSAVAATLAAYPTATVVSLPTPISTATPFSFEGLFCEYQFCIGHPTGMHFYDISAARDQANPSTYAQGILVTYNQNRFIMLSWQSSTDQSDPQFMMDLVLDDVDTRSGNLDIRLVENFDVYYYPITTIASPAFPNGAIAAWNCGDRAFGWKTYTVEENSGESLLYESLAKFSCKD